MTSRSSRTLAAVLMLVAIPAAASARQTDEETVRGVILAYAGFAEANNLAAIDTLFAEGRGVHIIEGAGVNRGWADYRDNHLQPELADFENLRYRFFSVEPQVRGSVAWAAFRYELSVDAPSGHLETEGRGTAVLEKREGRWMIVHLHTSG